jgi:hypothetical protein
LIHTFWFMQKIVTGEVDGNWELIVEAVTSEPILVTVGGYPSVVMMNPKLAAKALQALEDATDLKAAIKAMARIDAGAPTVSLEALAKELCIVLE